MIVAACRNGHESSAAANAWAVTTVTTSAGTLRRIESVCDDCGVGVATYVNALEAELVRGMLQHPATSRLERSLRERRN